MEAAERQGRLAVGSLEDLIARCPGRHGLRALREALAAYRPAPVTRSELERLFRDLCDSAGLTRPAFNALVAGFEVDAVWHDQRLVVELDSSFHDTTAAFERDRVRDATLQLAGYRVLRFTHRRVLYEPEAVVQTLRALLAAG
jgi:very-short-patch-repair endonuclease